MTTSSAAALSLTDVGVGFRGVRALDAVTFDIPAGGVSAVIGPNGAGKTTLFNCVSGIYRHDGSIALAGRPLDGLRAFRRAEAGIARTFQTPALLDDVDVMTNVMLGTYTRTNAGLMGHLWLSPRSRRDEAAAKEWSSEIIERVGLREYASTPVGALAHGDRRRVEIARALVARPTLLMLDEPAAGLSESEANALMDLIVEHGRETGMTCVLVEHDVALVMRYATTIAVLDAGRVLACGAAADIRKNPAVIAAYLGSDADVDAA
ncbi:ABC transporter ATP-binding protein [Microbacterium sp. A93]|uniref:ABC transporter ATP-binding protein n=1 Tax=unclassified Microbacterium TaxID=2609290 RepID=UPI003F4340CE